MTIANREADMSAKAVIRMPNEGKSVTLAGQPLAFRRPVGPKLWKSQMIADSSTLSPARSERLDDFETLQALVIFCGAGLLLSLLLAANGWI